MSKIKEACMLKVFCMAKNYSVVCLSSLTVAFLDIVVALFSGRVFLDETDADGG